MTPNEQIERLMHSANNCRQMLSAIDSKLAKALRCIEEGDIDNCRTMLDALAQALPEAIATLRHDEFTPSEINGDADLD